MMTNFSKNTGFAILLASLLFFSLTVLEDRFFRGIRFDLTEDGLYTLTDGTRSGLKAIEEPVKLDFYFSKSLAAPYPQLVNYGKRVEDMLRALKAAAPEIIDLSIIEPEPFSESEDAAVAAGLTGVPLQDGSTIYLGLYAQNSTDGDAVIPFFSEERETFLEYDLVKLILSLETQDRPKISLLSGLPLEFGAGGPQAALSGRAQPYVIYEQLQEFFEIETLDQNFAAIPTDTDILMLAHPPALDDDQLYLIDQYVLAGGRALIFLDPHAEALDPRAFAPNASNLNPLLAQWGVEIPDGQIVGDASLAQRVQLGGFGPDSVKDFIFWIGIRDDFLSRDDVVTGPIQNINIASAGVIQPLEDRTTDVTPIVTTSTVSMLYDASRAVGPPDPDALLRDLAPTPDAYTIAARISGAAKTAYPDRASEGHITNGDINLVLISDSDLLDNRFWVQVQDLLGQRIVVPIAGNGSFVVNLADHIAGSDTLLGLRARGIAARPFEVVDALRRDAEARYLSEEEILQERLRLAEARLAELEAQKPEGTTILSSEQENEIERFRAELLETRKALREVKRNLRRDIEQLGTLLAAINIGLVPMLLLLFALTRSYLRRRRQKHA